MIRAVDLDDTIAYHHHHFHTNTCETCLVSGRSCLEENLRAKEGGKGKTGLTSLLFPSHGSRRFVTSPSRCAFATVGKNKVTVVHSSCLFGAESYSGQRERKSVWQGFQYKSKICELVSGKLSKCLYIHSYTHLITSSAL